MKHPLDLTRLAPGDRVQDTLLVLDVDRRIPETGNAYTVLTLGNATGRLPTEPFWLERETEIAGVHRGHAVQVIGEVGRYRDRAQLKVSSLRVLPEGTADLGALLPSVGDVTPYWELLDRWRADVAKPRLKAVVNLFYEDADFRAKYERCPAAVRGHHAAVGGLLKHTAEVATIGRAVARTSGADLELVLAGALLHDIGKLDAYVWDRPFDHTPAGRLLGHVVLGALRFERRLAEEAEPPCTTLERDLLLHLILSHHGRRELGSPVEPMTLEAEALHHADNASAKTASMADVLADPEMFRDGSDVSRSHWTLDHRRAFRGGSDWGA